MTMHKLGRFIDGLLDRQIQEIVSKHVQHLADFDSHEAETAQHTNVDVRQTVLSGGVDPDGFANFLSAGTGLNVDLDATATPVQIAFAYGFGSNGNVDFVEEETADVTSAWTGTANSTDYLYWDRDISTGDLTRGKVTNYPPIYGTTYNKAGGVGKSLNLFEGTDGTVTCTDENADVTWAFSGTAQIDSDVQILSSNTLLLDGNSDYITSTGLTIHAGENEGGFSIDGWFRLNATGVEQTIINAITGNHISLRVSATNVMTLFLGNGSSWSIANAQAGTTTLSTAINYYFKLQWDKAAYKVYLGTSGTAAEEISVASSTAFATDTNVIYGATQTPSLYFNGHLAIMRYNVGPQTNTAPTVPTTAYKGLAMDGEHWFNLNTMKMTVWNDTTGAWDIKQRVFVGEAVCGASSVSSVVAYALKGEYDSGWFDIPISAKRTKDHNIGVFPLETQQYLTDDPEKKSWIIEGHSNTFYQNVSQYAGSPVVYLDRLQTVLRGQSTNTAQFEDQDGNVRSSSTSYKRIIQRRGW